MFFNRNATVDVIIVLVDVNPVSEGVHGKASGVAQVVAILQPAHDEARKNVACAWKLDRYLLVRQEKMLVGELVATYHGMLTVYNA